MEISKEKGSGIGEEGDNKIGVLNTLRSFFVRLEDIGKEKDSRNDRKSYQDLSLSTSLQSKMQSQDFVEHSILDHRTYRNFHATSHHQSVAHHRHIR